MDIEARFRTKSARFVDERKLELKAGLERRLERSLSSQAKGILVGKVVKS